MMNRKERNQFAQDLDRELLGYLSWLPEASILLGRDAGRAFAGGAYVSSALSAMAGIESLLRSRFEEKQAEPLWVLMSRSVLDEKLHMEVETLRKYRNGWAHVADPHSKDDELWFHDVVREDLKARSLRALETMRSVFATLG